MTDIVGIEFDHVQFPNTIEAMKFIAAHPELEGITEYKGFSLKRISKSLFMSNEPRDVLAWYGPMYRYGHIINDHGLSTYVVVLRRGMNAPIFSETNWPVPYAKTRIQRQAALLKIQNKAAKKAEDEKRRQEEKLKKVKPKKEKKTSASKTPGGKKRKKITSEQEPENAMELVKKARNELLEENGVPEMPEMINGNGKVESEMSKLGPMPPEVVANGGFAERVDQ